MSNHYTPDSSQEYGELIAELKTSVTKRLRDLLTKMLGEADEKLLDMADAAAYSHEKDVFYMLKKKLLQTTCCHIPGVCPAKGMQHWP